MVRLRTFHSVSLPVFYVEFMRQQKHLIQVLFYLHLEFGTGAGLWLRVCVCVCFRMDATLKELTSLVKEVYPEARKKGTHFSFSIVFPDPRGKVYRLVTPHNSTGWIHAAGLLLTGLNFEYYALKHMLVPHSGWKKSAVLYPAGRAQMTPWRCSLSASRLETIWT